MILGAILLLIAALGGLPIGNQPIPPMDIVWRYILAVGGIVLLVIGVGLILREHVDEKNTQRRLGSDATIKFASDKAASQYLLRRIREAKKSVCDLTYKGSSGPGKTILFFSNKDHDEYLHIIEEVSKRVKYREITMFLGKESRVSKARRLVSNAGEYYQLAGYADLPDKAPPRHNFIIIDDEEVILERLAIRQPEIVGYFCGFYDELWSSAIPIRVSTTTNLELIERAERLLESQEQAACVKSA